MALKEVPQSPKLDMAAARSSHRYVFAQANQHQGYDHELPRTEKRERCPPPSLSSTFSPPGVPAWDITNQLKRY